MITLRLPPSFSLRALHPFPSSRAVLRRYSCPLSFTARMSSTESASKPKQEWLVILPDYSGVLDKRMQVRPHHLKALEERQGDGFWKLGGATLDEEIKEGQGPKINGSVMLAKADSREEVIRALKHDVYTTSGVWNWDKVQVIPFKSVFIRP